jgi:hypothetical protein
MTQAALAPRRPITAASGFDPIKDLPFPQGKYKGFSLSQIAELDPQYLIFIADEWSSPTWKALARQALGLLDDDGDGDDEGDEFPQSDGNRPASIVFPRVVFEWQQEMREEFKNNPEALVVVEKGLVKLKQLCSRLTGKKFLPEDANGEVSHS